jgi:tRNA threonylcarbamoyladenosine biosynthesis protein TsaB
MKILAVDTSTSSGSIALVDSLKIMAEWSLESAQTHNRRLLGTVDEMLGNLCWSLEDLDALAVTLGPGSFTGIRIGISTIKTLAWALNKPYVGVPTLDALAAPLQFASLPVCAMLDARRKEIYVAFYQPDGLGTCRKISPYQVVPPQSVVEQVRGRTLFCGDGWSLYRDYFLKELGDLAVEPGAPYHLVHAAFVADLARRRLEQGLADDPMTSAPLYVRPSEAELLGTGSRNGH